MIILWALAVSVPDSSERACNRAVLGSVVPCWIGHSCDQCRTLMIELRLAANIVAWCSLSSTYLSHFQTRTCSKRRRTDFRQMKGRVREWISKAEKPPQRKLKQTVTQSRTSLEWTRGGGGDYRGRETSECSYHLKALTSPNLWFHTSPHLHTTGSAKDVKSGIALADVIGLFQNSKVMTVGAFCDYVHISSIHDQNIPRDWFYLKQLTIQPRSIQSCFCLGGESFR